MAAYIYSDNGLVASTQPDMLQRLFNFLALLFDWFGLRANTRKMVSMYFQTCHTPVRMLVVAYERLKMGGRTDVLGAA